MGKKPEQTAHKEDMLMANKLYMIRRSVSLFTREMQIKTVVRYHYMPL